MTIGWWIFLGVALIGGITVGALIVYDGNVGGGIGTILGAVILSILIACFGFWWCNNTFTNNAWCKVNKDLHQ